MYDQNLREMELRWAANLPCCDLSYTDLLHYIL